MRVMHALLAEKAVCRWVTRLDQWAHFHRFHVRPVCDVYDWLHGVSGAEIVRARNEKTPAHERLRSRQRHPSNAAAA